MRHLAAQTERTIKVITCDMVAFPGTARLASLKNGSASLDPQGRLCHSDLLILDLNGHVIDLELFFQDGLYALQDRGCVFHVGHDDMSGE
jgi:hypothetical protein